MQDSVTIVRFVGLCKEGMREDTRGRVGGGSRGYGALEVLKAWCQVRVGRIPGPLDVLMSGCVPAVLGGP
jgi:hypothetical protein